MKNIKIKQRTSLNKSNGVNVLFTPEKLERQTPSEQWFETRESNLNSHLPEILFITSYPPPRMRHCHLLAGFDFGTQ